MEKCWYCNKKFKNTNEKYDHVEKCRVKTKLFALVMNFDKKIREFTKKHRNYYILDTLDFQISNKILKKIRNSIERSTISKKIPEMWFGILPSNQPSWFEHVFYTKSGILIAEPYTLNKYDVKSLLEFCEKKKLYFHITGESLYSPGHTLRIIIYPEEER